MTLSNAPLGFPPVARFCFELPLPQMGKVEVKRKRCADLRKSEIAVPNLTDANVMRAMV